MPGCPGTSLARGCHEDPELRSMRVLMLTAHRDEEVTLRVQNLGVSEVMYKPFEPQALVDAVAALLARLEDPAFQAHARWAGVDPEIGDEARDA